MQPTIFLLPLTESTSPADELICKLNIEQRERTKKMRIEKRRQSLSGWLLIRVLACRQLGVPNHTLHFAVGEHGKPFLQGWPYFHFSLSHTRGAVVTAIADQPVGVDVESMRTVNTAIANRFFALNEQAFIFQEGLLAQSRFLEVWTRKEAWIKRMGMGLSTPLTSFDTLDSEHASSLYTLKQEDCTLSCCCSDISDHVPLQRLSEQWLLDEAAKLSDCE